MKKNWLLAGAFGFLAAIIYFASMADYAFPGESARLMVIWKGLEAGTASDYPLMSLFARMLGSGNLLAPIFGVVAVLAFFHLVAAFVRWRMTSKSDEPARQQVSLVAAVVATVVFMLSPAVRSAATHVEPRLFDFAWALLAFALAFPFTRMGKRWVWLFPLPLGLMIAMGLCDSAVFLMLFPAYVALVGFVSTRAGARPYIPWFLLLLSTLLSFWIVTACFGIDMLEVLKHIAQEVKGYRSSFGWVFVTLFATLPFVVALFSSGRAFVEKPGFVQWVFHATMSFVSILAVATPLSPSALMEPYGVLPVLSCAFAAAVSGYLVAYWWVNRRQTVALVAGVILTFVLAVTSVWNLFSFDGDSGAFADKVARKIVSDLGSRRWFITDGTLDDHLKLVAADSGKDLNIISLAKDLDPKYLEKLAEVVEAEGVGGSRNGALRLSLSLGVLPFVQDWFSSDPSVAKDVAVFGAPDLWYSANITPVPEFFFFGADDKIVPDWSAWKEFDAILQAPKGWGSYHDRKVTNPVDRMRFALRRHLGFVANNRGVYLQDQKKDDEAFKMYELVLNEIDHDNICAIFNEVAMVGQKHAQAVAKQRELERMLKSAVEDKNRRYLLWRLGTYYGYIRNPDTFVRLGHAWARSGRPGDALSQIRRAIDFVPTDKRTVLLNMMASLYASENDQAKSRQIYESILAKDAKDHDALIGMMRLELMDGNSQKALEYLQRATENSGDSKRAKIELAMVAMMKNELSTARDLLKKVTDADTKDMQAWSLLAAVTMQQVDAAKDEKAKSALIKELENQIVPAMEKGAQNQFDYYLQATKGFLLLRKGEEKRRQARDAFAMAVKSRPDIAATQNMVLGLDISLDDKENAEVHARDVLRRNRNAPLANYVMGSLALGKGKNDEAEMYLRKAAEAPQPVPLALNDLAEVLRRGKRFPEAERYARLATEKAPSLYVAWETLGAILMGANRNLDEAESCIRKACELSKDKNGKEADIRMLVSLARVQIARGNKEHAKLTIRKVRARENELSEFEKREFEEVAKSAR